MRDWCEWAAGDDIRHAGLQAAFDLTVNGGVMGRGMALRALEYLRRESVRMTKEYVGAELYRRYFPSRRTGGPWKEGNPIGVVDHYTAGIHAKRTLRWFSNEPRKVKYNSSANVVITPEGEIIIVVDPVAAIAWHARRDSHTHIGIEHVNAGLLCKKNGRYYYQGTRLYPQGWTPNIQKVGAEYWEPYTTAQIISNIVLKRWLVTAIPTLNRSYFVDHEVVDPLRKRDCGPLWPLQAINDLAFSSKPLRDMRWAQKRFLGVEDVADFRKEVFSR